MSYTVEQFLNLDLSARSAKGDGQVRCADCKVELRENLTGYRKGLNGPCCSDCYFDELSHLVEDHPVGLPALRR